MKKKQVVALLLAAAMTTASFLPSTGFFNVMEAQAEATGIGENSDVNNDGYLKEKIVLGSVENVVVETKVVSPSWAQFVKKDVNSKPELVVTSGEAVKINSIVSGSGIVSSQAIASMAGLKVEVADPKGEVNGVNAISTANITSTGATDYATSPAFEYEFEKVTGWGKKSVSFVSGGASPVTFGAFDLIVKLKYDDPSISVKSLSSNIVTGTALQSGNTVSASALFNVDEGYISGGAVNVHYQWYHNDDNDAEVSTSAAWKKVGDADSLTVKTPGAYYVKAWYGNNDTNAKFLGTWKVKDEPVNEETPISVTAGSIKYAENKLSLEGVGYVISGSTVGSTVRSTVNKSSLKYAWYKVSAESRSSLVKMVDNDLMTAVVSKSAFATSSSYTIKETDNWEKTDVIVVVYDDEGEYNLVPYAVCLGKEDVEFTPDKKDTTPTNNRGSNSRSSGSSGSSGTSTGTNSSTGSNTANNNTSNTGTTNNTSTTTTPTTTPTSNTVTNADGSKTTTTSETKADGTKVETTKTEYPDGSTLEVTKETKPDGTTIETTVETAANGDKATTVYTVSPNGTKSKKVSIVKADGTSETSTITENKDGSATIVNETKDASGTTSMAYSLPAGAAGVTLDKIETTAKKVVIPAKIAIAGGAATLKGVTSLKANTLTLEGKTIKVTKVGAAALKGNKTATNLVVGKNIKTIGKQAFMNASKVKTVNIKGNVNTVGKNSFKNINKKATIKIKTTAKQFKALKKKIKNKGAAPAKVTYKRVK